MITICKNRVKEGETYEDSWMAHKASQDNYYEQYIVSIYFVTTTVSTCGYGDINASLPQDPDDGSYDLDALEAGVIFLLQFSSMLFYSLTIEKVQSLMINDSIPHTEYSN